MQWRTKRKLTYTAIALLPFILVVGAIYVTTFFPQPTCFDEEKNQDEVGVDCGGSCVAVCQDQTGKVSILWDRSFQVGDDLYSLAAYIENPNTDLIAKDVPYRFRLYDKDNFLITEKRGSITILPQSSNVAFLGGVDTNGRVPGRTVFSFIKQPFWENTERTSVDFLITNRSLTTNERPRLSFDVTNENKEPFFDIELTGIIYNSDGEAVHLSKTVIDSLDVQETREIIFTWREPFSSEGDTYRSEILPTSYRTNR